MDDIIDDIIKLKKQVKKLGREKDKNAGRVEQSSKTLKKNFNCSNLNKAKQLLRKVQEEEDQLKNQYKSKRKTFKEKWKDKLNMEDDEDGS